MAEEIKGAQGVSHRDIINMGEPLSDDNKGRAHSFSAKNKRVTSRTQNNATNAWKFNSAPNNNNKSNSNLAVPFYAYFTDNNKGL